GAREDPRGAAPACQTPPRAGPPRSVPPRHRLAVALAHVHHHLHHRRVRLERLQHAAGRIVLADHVPAAARGVQVAGIVDAEVHDGVGDLALFGVEGERHPHLAVDRDLANLPARRVGDVEVAFRIDRDAVQQAHPGLVRGQLERPAGLVDTVAGQALHLTVAVVEQVDVAARIDVDYPRDLEGAVAQAAATV